MPHLLGKTTGPELATAATRRPPFGPGFNDADLAGATVLEVWGSSFNDPGADWTEFRLLDAQGQLLASRQLGGY